MPLPKAPSKKGSLLTQLTSNATPNLTSSTTHSMKPSITAPSEQPVTSAPTAPVHSAQKPHRTTPHNAPPAAKAKPASSMSSATAPAIEQTAPQNAPKNTSNHGSKTIASNATAQLAKQPIASKKAPHSHARQKSKKAMKRNYSCSIPTSCCTTRAAFSALRNTTFTFH